MKSQDCKKLFLLSKDRVLINELRKTFSSIEIVVNSDCTKEADLIILDKREQRDIPTDLKWHCKIICIVNKITEKEMGQLSSNGIEHILTLPEFKYWLFCLIKRYLGFHEDSTHRYKYKGITVCRDTSSIIYNDCRVLLTNNELSIFEDILRKECPYCRVENPNTKSTICRINKKTKRGIGIKIIGNRYNQGYYISI